MHMLRKQLHMIINYSQTDNILFMLAKYMIYEYSGTTKLSINTVIKDTLISKSSILKLCSHLGYDSWRTFSADLQKSCEREKMLIDSIKVDTGMLHNKRLNIEMQRQEYLKVWEQYQRDIHITDLIQCVEYIDKAKRIIILGDIVESNMFVQLQMILVQYKKELQFIKILDANNLKRQIDSVDESTLVIVTNSMTTWELTQEHDTLDPVFYLDRVKQSKATIVYIGQGDIVGKENRIYQISLPFSFNRNFIHLLLQEFIYQLGYIYIHTH